MLRLQNISSGLELLAYVHDFAVEVKTVMEIELKANKALRALNERRSAAELLLALRTSETIALSLRSNNSLSISSQLAAKLKW